MHRTDTIDYVYVMSSGLSLVLEDGEVPLNVGECIIQRATPHGWRNRGDHEAQILCVMISLTAADGLALISPTEAEYEFGCPLLFTTMSGIGGVLVVVVPAAGAIG